jgi:hypothetical protein
MEQHVVLRKTRGHAFDTGEETSERLRAAGLGMVGYPIETASEFSVGPFFCPTISTGVFHAWHVTRLMKNSASVVRETGDRITPTT